MLHRHHLGTARERDAALASLTAADAGQVTDAALEGRSASAWHATHAGQVVALDTLYVGRLKGVGAVRQLTAVDIATRIAVGSEFAGQAFTTRAADLGLVHHRIPPRFPNHNAVCERFHGTVLREFYRPRFLRGRVYNLPLLDRS